MKKPLEKHPEKHSGKLPENHPEQPAEKRSGNLPEQPLENHPEIHPERHPENPAEKLQPTEDILIIRRMMEKSTKFLSLHGFSGVIAGVAALAGAAFAWIYLLHDPAATDFNRTQEAFILLAVAVAVLVVSIGAGLWLACRKAHRSGHKLMNRVTYRILYALAVPLVTGGIFCMVQLLRGDLYTVISATLIFYGLALVAASRYTYGEIHYLGLTEIVTGLAAALLNGYGIFLWAFGFGVCHIVYGLVMYLKYDNDKKKNDERIDFGT